jgi:hypothetical protein
VFITSTYIFNRKWKRKKLCINLLERHSEVSVLFGFSREEIEVLSSGAAVLCISGMQSLLPRSARTEQREALCFLKYRHQLPRRLLAMTSVSAIHPGPASGGFKLCGSLKEHELRVRRYKAV